MKLPVQNWLAEERYLSKRQHSVEKQRGPMTAGIELSELAAENVCGIECEDEPDEDSYNRCKAICEGM